MVGWPLYRLGKNIYRRGRLPDMKRWRVVVSTVVVVAAILFVCFVPVPVGRIRSPGILQMPPEAQNKVFIRYSGRLEKLLVSAGDHVEKGDELAIFSNQQLQRDLDDATTEMKRLEKTVSAHDGESGQVSQRSSAACRSRQGNRRERRRSPRGQTAQSSGSRRSRARNWC